ncbi:hypothetical protein T03_10136 [Trichinella britovi]|uniref:Uncharacterized protein n=1 Tax=Trichinella britovi TaxID=45882 RepID=A0A0V1D437_TRIBR|nr:hypothetical protein T03_10136 [Trichinella britovi]
MTTAFMDAHYICYSSDANSLPMKKCTGFNGAQCNSLRSRERRAAQCEINFEFMWFIFLIPFHVSFHHPIGSYTASAPLDTCKSIPPMRGKSLLLQWRQHLLQAI